MSTATPQPPATAPVVPPPQRHVARRWLIVSGLAVLCLVAVGVAFLALNWPFTEQRLIDALQEASSRTVTIDRFHRTYFPPGCVAEGIKFQRLKHKEKPPLITIQKLIIQGSYAGLVQSPCHLTKVQTEGMRVTVPPRAPDGSNPIMPLTEAKGGKPVAIGTVIADGTELEFISERSHQVTFRLKVKKLALDGVGSHQPISYRATVWNTEPSGEIISSGRFGPWNPDDPGRSPLTGSYIFQNADLATFHGISGILSSRGGLSGTLDHIAVAGHASVPQLHIGHSGHTLNVESDFRAVVNATDGNTYLEQVYTHWNNTTLFATGQVTGEEGKPGKTVALDISTTDGRVEDLLDVVLEAKQPPLTGSVILQANVKVPPGPQPFLDRLNLSGNFGLGSAKFASKEIQNKLDKLSKSADDSQRHDGSKSPLTTVVSNLRGSVVSQDGVATLTRVSMSTSGSDLQIHGTCNLITEKVDLHGVLKTRGKVYVTQSGFKSLLLRVASPFLKHESHETVVPFKITGTYPDTSMSMELFGKNK